MAVYPSPLKALWDPPSSPQSSQHCTKHQAVRLLVSAPQPDTAGPSGVRICPWDLA